MIVRQYENADTRYEVGEQITVGRLARGRTNLVSAQGMLCDDRGSIIGRAVRPWDHSTFKSKYPSTRYYDGLVAEKTDPTMITEMMNTKFYFTELGGLLSHAAITAREMGAVALVGMGPGWVERLNGKVLMFSPESNLFFFLNRIEA